MPRVSGRSVEETTGLLIRAAWETVESFYASEGAGPTLPAIQMPVVLGAVNKRLKAEGLKPVTTGFISANFGGRDEFLNEVLRSAMSPDYHEVLQGSLESARQLSDGADPSQVRREMVTADVNGMTQHPGWSRAWWALHSRAVTPTASELLLETYELFDEAYMPLYQAELQARARRLKDGVTLGQLASALTALHEGAALRILATNDPGTLVPEWIIAASEAIIEGLTDPVQTPAESTPPTPVSLAVVDPHEVTRLGVSQALAYKREHLLSSVATYATLEELLAGEVPQASVVELLSDNPLEVTLDQIAELSLRGSIVVILTSETRPYPLGRAVAAGARAVVSKNEPIKNLKDTLDSLIARDQRGEDGPLDSVAEFAPVARLSKREVAVLKLLAQGLPSTEIEERLGLTPATLKAMTSRIMSKFKSHDLGSQAGVLKQAREDGYLV